MEPTFLSFQRLARNLAKINSSNIRRYCVIPPKTTNNITNIASDDTKAENNSFDEKAVEQLINGASKDMPIDMTNPYERDRMQCLLCRYNIELDYKNVKLLSQFVSSFTGNIYDKHITRLCSDQQDKLVYQIRRSRNAGYMPTLFKKVEFLKDPKLFDPNSPIKPHPH